jgi:ADP-heptose:LPS heptosyltransferase
MKTIENLARSMARISTPLIDRILKMLSCSRKLHGFLKTLEIKRLDRIDRLKRVLIVPDINIGDAIMTQAFIPPLRNFFPDVEVSYAYQRKAYPLVKANPNIDRHFPFFGNLGYPSRRDSVNLNNLVKENQFDLIVNFCPYMPKTMFKGIRAPLIYPLRLIANIIRAYTSRNHIAHLVYQQEMYAQELAEEIAINTSIEAQATTLNSGLRLYFKPQVWEETQRTLDRLNLNSRSKKIFYNPDTGSRYTLVPFEFQSKLLHGILSRPETTVFLNCGFVFKDIEKKLLEDLPLHMRRKVVVIPKDVPLDILSGLIDQSEMAITGDTAPLHIAVAKKVILKSDRQFKNCTAIVGIFGATSARVYGYDSFSKEHLSAFQDAPSKTFEGYPPCKNLSCLDKLFKSCRKIRCFEPLKAEEVIEYILNYSSP